MSTFTKLPSLSSVNAASKRHNSEQLPYDPALTPFDPLILYDLSSVGSEFEPGVELKRLQDHQHRRDELLVRAWKESFLIEGGSKASPRNYISLKRYENRIVFSNCLMTALFSILLAALGGYLYGVILVEYGSHWILP